MTPAEEKAKRLAFEYLGEHGVGYLDMIADTTRAIEAAVEEAVAAERERGDEALRRYGQHFMNCDRVNMPGGSPCTCGLDAIRARAALPAPAAVSFAGAFDVSAHALGRAPAPAAEPVREPFSAAPFCACGRAMTDCDGSRARCAARKDGAK